MCARLSRLPLAAGYDAGDRESNASYRERILLGGAGASPRLADLPGSAAYVE